MYFKRSWAQKLRLSVEKLHIFVEVWEPFCTVKIRSSWEIIQVDINIYKLQRIDGREDYLYCHLNHEIFVSISTSEIQ